MPLELLAQKRIQRAVDELSDVRQNPNPLVWSSRLNLVEATDNELIAVIDAAKIVNADLVANDAKAVVRYSEPLRTKGFNLPNIKHGFPVSQETIQILQRIEAQGGGNVARLGDFSSVDRYLVREFAKLIRGVQQEVEVLAMGMMLDTMSYNRMGIIFSGLTWDMPSDLKVTVSTPWSTAASATPVADLNALNRVAKSKYGRRFRRLSMRTENFDEMIATTEFQNKAKLFLPNGITFGADVFPVDNLEQMSNFAQRVTGFIFEFNDDQYYTENSYGVKSANYYHPEDKVIVTDPALDNNDGVWDIGNAIVTESTVATLLSMDGGASGVIGGFNGETAGPVGYAVGPVDLNPPNITGWAVQRAWPRKFDRGASALLTV